jgi:signal transduction histidine kinase
MSPRAPSLQRRLGLGLGLGFAVSMALGCAFVLLALRFTGESLLIDRLRHDLESLTSAVTVAGGEPTVTRERLTLVYRQPYSGHYYRISYGDAVLRSRSLWDQDIPVADLSAGERWQGRVDGPDEQTLLVLAHGVAMPGGPVTIAVAEESTLLDTLLGRLFRIVVLFATTAVAALLIVQLWLVRSALRPLAHLQDELHALERGERRELGTEGLPAEVLPLVERLNGALALLVARLERSRKAAGNLAHALKTPLALLTHDVDELPPGSVRTRLRAQLGALHGTVERELHRARLAGGSGLHERCRPRDVIDALLDTLGRIYRDRSPAVDLEVAEDLSLPIDHEDLTELLGAILDNAYQWSRSRVRISATDGAIPCMVVEDDGPGVPESDLPHLLERGGRLDESRAGSGLGLAIAHDIVTHYGGTLALGRSALGGLRVGMALPGSPTASAPAGSAR